MFIVGQAHSAWPLGAWLMLAAMLVGGGVGVATDILSPGLALDLVSLWPGLTPALLAGAILPFWRSRPPRAMALPPLLAFTWLVLGGAAHFSGWDQLPSSSVELQGPTPQLVVATLVAEPAGALRVDSHPEGNLLYRVGWIRRGGQVGVPAATEITHPDLVQIRVEDRGNTTFHRYAGWQLSLDPDTTWGLLLGGTAVEARLDDLTISSLELTGAGMVSLGSSPGPVQVLVGGDYVISIPAGVAARLQGEGTVPSDWRQVEGGLQSPGGNDGWLFVVEPGASIEITTP